MGNLFLLLSGDVETNPGPSTCGQKSCPGNGVLGTSNLDLTTDDPFTRALNGANFALGGINNWVNSVEEAVNEFVAREYPDDDLAKDGLTVIPDIAESRCFLSPKAKKAGLIHEEIQNFLSSSGSDEKKRILMDMSDIYRAEEAEKEVFEALRDTLSQEVGAIISSHKTGYSLLEKKLAAELRQHIQPGTVEFKIALTEKLCQALGVRLDLPSIESEVSYYFTPTLYTIHEIKQVIQVQENKSDGGRHEILRRNADTKQLKEMLEDNNHLQTPEGTLDPFKHLKLYRMKLELNKNRKEHDTMVIYPKHKSVIHLEVKSVKQGKDPNNPAQKAIDQLKGGLEELNRIHGHILDDTWKMTGVIAFPDMDVDVKNRLCLNKKICDLCKKFIVIGKMETEIPLFINSQFTASNEFTDYDTWRITYKKLLERMAAFIHLAPAKMQILTGNVENVQGGSSVNDFIPDLLTCSVSDLTRWRSANHTGSTPSVMFLNKQQLSLWKEKRLIFLADYSVGKTTMLKSKAVSLALNGEKVLFVFLGTVNYWGQPSQVDAVMDIQNKQDFADADPNKNLVAVSARELQHFYSANAWNGMIWSPNILTSLEFYLKKQPSAACKHVFIDESPIHQSRFLLALHFASSRPFKASNMWKTSLISIIYLLVSIGIDWTMLLLPVLLILLMIPIWMGLLPSSFSPSATANQLNLFSDILPNNLLWIALHTRYFSDRTIGVGNQITKLEASAFKQSLNSLQFTVPELTYNMRNSSGIAEQIKAHGTYGNTSSQFNACIQFGRTPKTTRFLNSSQPIRLELSSYDNQLKDAVAYAYRKLLKVDDGQEDTCIIILMEDGRDTTKVITGLQEAGVSENNDITVYLKNNDVKNLQKFLKNQKGILLTTDVAFSGMEAFSVIYISRTGINTNHRGSQLRAVFQLVQISGACYDGHCSSSLLDISFMKCSSEGWVGVFYICMQCKVIVCNDCQLSCHTKGIRQDKGVETNILFKKKGGHNCNFDLNATIVKKFRFTGCECKMNGKCVLQSHDL